MKLHKNQHLSLVAEGRLTLQVPDTYVCLTKADRDAFDAEEIVEYPDDYFMYVTGSYKPLPCVGKQQGFLYFTQKGYDALKDELRDAFTSSRSRGQTWQDFEAYAEKHFADLEAATVKKIKKVKRELKQYESFVKTLR